MTNDEMWDLINGRIRAFYERVIMPFGTYGTEDDLESIEKRLHFHFYKSSLPSKWAYNFFRGIEKVETEIALHTRKLNSFNEEIFRSLQYVLQESFGDAYDFINCPPSTTDKTRSP